MHYGFITLVLLKKFSKNMNKIVHNSQSKCYSHFSILSGLRKMSYRGKNVKDNPDTPRAGSFSAIKTFLFQTEELLNMKLNI